MLKKAEEIELEFEPCEHAKEALTQLRQYKKKKLPLMKKYKRYMKIMINMKNGNPDTRIN